MFFPNSLFVFLDCLESFFGHQRALGRRNTNPTISEFGYNTNAIHSRRSVRGSNVLHSEN